MNQAPLQPGDVLDGHEIVGLLGRGGMGVVYRARRPGGGGDVALKTLLADLASEEADRFRREIALLSALRHPSIVPVLAAGEARGVLYYAMGIVEGESLEAKIRREGRLAPEEAARIVTEVAHAVAYAHERKIVHRDLKPANVLLDAAGRAFVTDFGLGLKLGGESERERLTRTGEILGTPWFMPPEQALGRSKSIDERADVYGLGAILYCALAGRPPFVGATALETIKLVQTSLPDPIEDVPQALDELLARALAKNPDDRPQTALELVSDLDEALHARPGLPRGLVRGLLVLAAICAAGTGALVWQALEGRRLAQHGAVASPSPVSSASLTNARLAPLLESIPASLERDRKTFPTRSLEQVKAIFAAPGTSESDRDRIRVAVGRIYDGLLSGDEARLESFAALGLPLPEDAPLRGRIAGRWLALAVERSPKGGLGAQRLQPRFDPSGRVRTDDGFEGQIAAGIRSAKPIFVAVGRARTADPSVPPFPAALEAYYRRLLLGAHVTGELSFREVWREALSGLGDHPIRDYLEARFLLEERGERDGELNRQVATVRLHALEELQGSRFEGAENAVVERATMIAALYSKAVEEHPGSEVVRAAEAALAPLVHELHLRQNRQYRAALEHVERALAELVTCGDSPAASELAELFLFDILRPIVWVAASDREAEAGDRGIADRWIAATVTAGAHVAPADRAYSTRFVEAAIPFAWFQGHPSDDSVGNEAVVKEFRTVESETEQEHRNHLGELAQSLTSSSPEDH